MRKLVVVLFALAALVAPAAAAAHPLGNFTVNRFSRVEVSGPRLYVRYVLDLAEIPTYQAGRIDAGTYAREIAQKARLSVGGKAAALRPVRTRLAHPRGAGGLDTTRLEVVLAGPRLDGTSRSEIAPCAPGHDEMEPAGSEALRWHYFAPGAAIVRLLKFDEARATEGDD